MLSSSRTFGSRQSLWPAKFVLLSVATCPGRVGPRVRVVVVVNRPVVRELLPHEPGGHVRDRPVPVVDVRERGSLPEVAVLARAGTRDDAPTAVPARRLVGRRQLAAPSAARSE